MKNSPQKMKASGYEILSTLSLILLLIMFSVSCVITTQPRSSQDIFTQCLSNHSNPSFPITSTIYTPDNSSFASVLQSYVRNLRFMTSTTRKPLAIVAAKHESHVQATVVCAKIHGLQIRIRSGGHDYEGLSYVSDVPFVVLDMFNLRTIDIDIPNQTAWVEAGATLGELYYRIAEKSKIHAFPAGVCPTLGVGGHFTGGGYGNMLRKYGLSSDNIIDAKFVDVKGRVLNRESMGEDLFWAIRGGGGASFGVILSWKIKLVMVPELVTVFRVERTSEQGATELVHHWQLLADKLPDELFIRLMLQAVSGSQKGTKTIKVSFMAFFLGQAEVLVPLINLSFPELGLQRKDCTEMSWVQSTLFWAEFPEGTPITVLLDRIPKGEIFLKRKSDYVKQPISMMDLEIMWKKMMKVEKVLMLWNPYGGKMSEISESETPFPHRAGNIFKIQYQSNWLEKGIEATNHYLNLTRLFHNFMTPYVSKNPREAFLNYRDLDIGSNSNGNTSYKEATVYGKKHFKGNFDRLVQVKTIVDPDNFFRNEQSIPTLPSQRKKRKG